MKLTKEQKKQIDDIILNYAQGAFLSHSWEDDPNDIMDALANGNPDNKVAIWEPLEYFAPEDIADLVEDRILFKELYVKRNLEGHLTGRRNRIIKRPPAK